MLNAVKHPGAAWSQTAVEGFYRKVSRGAVKDRFMGCFTAFSMTAESVLLCSA
jgi:hypothetical protein